MAQIRDNAGMSTAHAQHYDIVISGAGMVGLAMAGALADSGLSVALIDPQTPQDSLQSFLDTRTLADFDSRVSALTPASQAFLDRIGAWPLIEDVRVCPYYDMRVWEADGTGAIHFNADELHVPCLGHIVENRLVTAALATVLATKDNTSFLTGKGLTDLEAGPEGDYRILHLTDGTTLSCGLLIGADGARSKVRELVGFRTRNWHYNHHALVCTVNSEAPHQHTAWQRFMTTGPVACLPLFLPGQETQHYSSIVWSCEPAMAAELQAASAPTFATRLAGALEHRLGAFSQVSKLHSFPLHQQHATQYVRNGIALVGDAAHTIHPLAGQGVNLGLADVTCIDRVIRAALARGEPWSCEQVLSRYQRERKPANLGMMLGMEGFKRAFGSNDLLLRWLRNTGLKLADRVSPLKHELVQRAMGIK